MPGRRTWRVAAVPPAGGDAAPVLGPATRAYKAEKAALGVASSAAWLAMKDEQWRHATAQHREREEEQGASSSSSSLPGAASGDDASGTGGTGQRGEREEEQEASQSWQLAAMARQLVEALQEELQAARQARVEEQQAWRQALDEARQREVALAMQLGQAKAVAEAAQAAERAARHELALLKGSQTAQE